MYTVKTIDHPLLGKYHLLLRPDGDVITQYDANDIMYALKRRDYLNNGGV